MRLRGMRARGMRLRGMRTRGILYPAGIFGMMCRRG